MEDFEWVSVDPQEHITFTTPGPTAEEGLRIRAWLEPTEYDKKDSEYDRHRNSHAHGTNQWLFETPGFRRWHESESSSLLWLSGLPGSGKSVYASKLVDSLARDGSTVLYFFFRHIIDQNNTANGALRDWLAQLLESSESLQRRLWEKVHSRQDLGSTSTQSLWELLSVGLSDVPSVYIVADALDEMATEDIEPFLQGLLQLSKARSGNVKIVMTSRPVSSVQAPLRIADVEKLELDAQQIDVDISTYVSQRLQNSTISAEHHPTIMAAVPGRANGLFLFARLAMDSFLESDQHPAETLKELPMDLNVMYTELLRQNALRSGMSFDMQVLTMQLVTHCIRPLRLLELSQAVNTERNLSLNTKINLKDTKAMVRLAGGSLLQILPTELVSVVHHSFTEFLIGKTRKVASHQQYPVLEFKQTHGRLAGLCLRYLKAHGIMNLKNPDHEAAFENPSAFLRYAGAYWYVHAQKASSSDEWLPLIIEMNKKDVIQVLAKLSQKIDYERYEGMTSLGLAAMLGLDDYVKYLLENSDYVLTRKDGMPRSPLAEAAQQGYLAIAKMLLERGASVTEIDKTYNFKRTPLHYAAEGNHTSIVTLLVNHGADILLATVDEKYNGQGFGSEKQQSALEKACMLGHVESVSAMIPFIPEPDGFTKALAWAVDHSRLEVVELLIRSGSVKVNDQFQGATALMRASCRRNPRVVKFLLENGANVNETGGPTESKPRSGFTVLHCLSAAATDPDDSPSNLDQNDQDVKDCFQILLAAGADINQLDSRGQTPLLVSKDLTSLSILIKAGADPCAASEDGKTILNFDHYRCSEEMLRLAANAMSRARMSSWDWLAELKGEDPILTYVKNSKMKRAKALLLAGLPANRRDELGNGAFHYTTQLRFKGHEECTTWVTLLKTSGADINLRNLKGETPLHLLGAGHAKMLNCDNPRLFTILLQAGADLEAKNYKGETPLMAMARYGNADSLQAMVERGANIQTIDFLGRNLFFSAAKKRGNESTLQWLIDRGFNPTSRDREGSTIFHAVMRHANRRFRYCFDEFDHLIRFGVGPFQPDYTGRTPLHTIAADAPFDPDRFGNRREIVLPGKRTTFEYVLELFQANGLDEADNFGVTALHLAATFHEGQTRLLLEAGANPLLVTNEKITVLHLAARGRQPNILSMALDYIKRRPEIKDSKAFVDLKDNDGKSALSYACMSGVFESVRILLQSGATNEPDLALDAFVSFETELQNWPSPSGPRWSRDTFDKDYGWWHCAGSVTIKDKSRTICEPSTNDGELRLDEIIELATNDHLPTLARVDEAIQAAGSNGHDYTVECLINLRYKLDGTSAYKHSHESLSALARREAVKQLYSKDVPADIFHERGFISTLNHFLSLREYGLAQTLVTKMDLDETQLHDILHQLVSEGRISLLFKIVTPEIISRFFRNKASTDPPDVDGFLVAACRRERPNMDVVRFLVEHCGVDVNDRARERRVISEWAAIKNETALHVLARGTHWWQKHEAIPYLVQQGANLEAEDSKDDTPLSTAINHYLLQPGNSIQSIETLVELGANIKGGSRGGSCLAKAATSPHILRILLKSLPTLGLDELNIAITSCDVTLVELALQRGADPNGPIEPSRTEPCGISYYHGIDTYGKQDRHPLHHALALWAESHDRCSEEKKQIVNLLLEKGANPSARYQNLTVAHCAMASNENFAMLFSDIPSLDLSAVDDNGLTLFLVACRWGNHDAAMVLQSRGADIYACDKYGRNALHHILFSERRQSNREILHRLVSDKTLVNHADNDGQTPIFEAARQSDLVAIKLLISNGADPWTMDRSRDSMLANIPSTLR